ncbi:MAG: DNA-directed RNA polymerase subunit F [Candidatus Marsarchaeota archaeon]|nr:DNA-directed RNA polymerase subunit F [Candidatus Marsarchaeota archaeon]
MQHDEKSGKAISIPEALEILETRKKDGELGYEQQLSYEHAKKFAQLSADKANKLREELEGLGISAKSSVSLVNAMPTDVVQVKQVLAAEKTTPPDGTAEKALVIIEKNRGK